MTTFSKDPAQRRPRTTLKGSLSTKADRRRLLVLPDLAPATKSELGQFMTPAPVAEFMASMFSNISQPELNLLDPGAGVGSLTAAFIQRVCLQSKRPQRISVTAYELDSNLADGLQLTLEECVKATQLMGIQMTYCLLRQDFIHHASEILEGGLFVERPCYTHVIANPPYKKIQSLSAHRKVLRRAGIEVTNLYAAFVALAARLLVPGGELVAITPRSFANGPYFLPFRKILLAETSVRQIHILETRDAAFRDDSVLQENIIYHLSQTTQSPEVIITASQDTDFQNTTSRRVPFADIIHPGDANLIIHIPACEEDAELVRRIRLLTHSLNDLGITVSTGPVVDFRLRTFIHQDVTPASVPLIYPAHFYKGTIVWPRTDGKKPNSIDHSPSTRKWLMPNGYYTLTRRFSSKEEKRRIVTAVFDPHKVTADWIGFENHLNIFHIQGQGLSPTLARGLALYLNSTIVDKFFRLFNGHTQVNATDLRALPYPRLETLMSLGKQISSVELPPQHVIDELVEQIVFAQPQHNTGGADDEFM